MIATDGYVQQVVRQLEFGQPIDHPLGSDETVWRHEIENHVFDKYGVEATLALGDGLRIASTIVKAKRERNGQA